MPNSFRAKMRTQMKNHAASPAAAERYYRIVTSPIGPLTVITDSTSLKAIGFGAAKPAELKGLTRAGAEPPAIMAKTCTQLGEYFAGKRSRFALKVAPEGTEFQRKVWQALREIPFGETASYKDIAEGIGNVKACRAVGAANGKNPIPIVIPCHRVIGADGTLTGFAGGIGTKAQLLELEGWSN